MRRHSFVVGLILVALTASPATAASGRSLTDALARSHEVPGLTTGKQMTESSLTAYLNAIQDRATQRTKDRQRLSAEGFRAVASEQLGPASGGPSQAEGLSSVERFGSPSGAKRELRYYVNHRQSFNPGEVIRTFTVAGVPSASGFTATSPSSGTIGGAATVMWRQGSCYLQLGDYLPEDGSQGHDGVLADRLVTGTQAIAKRTGGRCP